MKKFLLTTAAVLCLTLPANAQEAGKKAPADQQKSTSYLTVRMGGGRFHMRVDDDKQNTSLFLLQGAVGMEIAPGIRGEVELTASANYETEDIDPFDYIKSEHSVVNLSLNVLKDFDLGTVKPYVGVGVGAATFYDEIKYNMDVLGVSRVRGTKNYTSSVLSANAQAGLAFTLTDNIMLDANVRYTHFGNYKNKFFGEKTKMKNHSADATIGIRYNF